MNNEELDRTIEAALRSRADQVGGDELRPLRLVPVRRPQGGGVRRWGLPLLAAAVVAAIAVGTTLAVRHGDSGSARPATGGPGTSGPVTTATGSTSAAPTGTPSTTATSTGAGRPVVPNRTGPVPPGAVTTGVTAVATPATLPSPYQPLWPFVDGTAALAWQRSTAGVGGAPPWQLDAGQTALRFTRSYLGFSDIDRVVASRYDDADEAHISVGYLLPTGAAHTAATLHLLRFGTGSSAPWEVVGSDDSTLSFTLPAYGSQVASPVVISGRITGVDESIRIWIRSLGGSGSTVLQAIPAGGQDSAWTSKPLPVPTTGVLTVVIATGGHLTDVERFAVQGVHT